jgi:hypothetical protein
MDVLAADGQSRIGIAVSPSTREVILFTKRYRTGNETCQFQRLHDGGGFFIKVVDSDAVSFAFTSDADGAVPSRIYSLSYKDMQCVTLVFDQNDQAESSETSQPESCVVEEPSEEVGTAELNDAALTDEVGTHDITPNGFEDELMNQPENDQLQH